MLRLLRSPEVLVLRRAGDPQGDTELRRVGRRVELSRQELFSGETIDVW